MRWHGRIALLAVAAAAVVTGGCRSEVDPYLLIQLGRPLAATHPLATRGSRMANGHEWNEGEVVNVPAVAVGRVVRTAEDSAGNVLAKRRERVKLRHWLFYLSIDAAWTMEVQVPEEAFGEPSKDWKVDLLALYEDPQPQPGNLVEHLLLTARSLRSRTFPWPGEMSRMDDITVSLFERTDIVAHDKAPPMEELADVPGLFDGMTTPGTVRSYASPSGGICRVQSLPGRRIRIESRFFGFFKVRTLYSGWTSRE